MSSIHDMLNISTLELVDLSKYSPEGRRLIAWLVIVNIVAAVLLLLLIVSLST